MLKNNPLKNYMSKELLRFMAWNTVRNFKPYEEVVNSDSYIMAIKLTGNYCYWDNDLATVYDVFSESYKRHFMVSQESLSRKR